MSKRATIKDVAVSAGVTHTTVSRVIHNDVRISELTKQRVRSAMKTLDYQPNLIARGLVRNRTQVVAMITPEVEIFSIPLIRSVAESCSKHDYAMMLFPTNTWIDEALSFENVARNWLVDGILIYNLIYHEKVTEEIRSLQSRNIPFVFVNKFLHCPDVNAVAVDNNYGVSLAVEHLVQLGHKRIGTLHGDLTSVDGFERHMAFKEALRRHGIAYEESICAGPYWHEDQAYQEMNRILGNGSNLPSAMFCANDAMALGAIAAIRDRGLKVPGDIAIVGFDDSDAGQRFDPPLTSVKPPLFNVGARALDLLMQVIQEPQRTPEQYGLKSDLIVRKSTTG